MVGILTASASLFAAAFANPGSSVNNDKFEGRAAGLGCSQTSAIGKARLRRVGIEPLDRTTVIVTQNATTSNARAFLHEFL